MHRSTMIYTYFSILFNKSIRISESMDDKQPRRIKIRPKDEQKQVKFWKENSAEAQTGPQCRLKTSQQTDCERKGQPTLEIVFDKGWMQAYLNKSPVQFQDELSRLVEKTIDSQASFFKKITYFFVTLVSFINEKRFLLNWNIFQILARGKMKSSDIKVLFKRQYLLQIMQNSQKYQVISQKCTKSIRNVIHTYYRLYKVGSRQQSYAKQEDTYLKQLQKALYNLSLITKESHFHVQISTIDSILIDFMTAVYRNQYILIVTNILEILNRIHHKNKYFAYFLQLWLSNVSNKDQMGTLKQKLKQIHGKCIKLASQFESEEENNKKLFQNRKNFKKTKQRSHKSTNADQTLQKNEPQVSIMTQMQQSPKIYIKGYATRHKISKMKWIHQTFVKYIEVDRSNKKNILNYKLKAKVKQNQMHVLRYLRQLKRNYVFKYDISVDSHPENQQFQRDNSVVTDSICFEFQSRKADKDYTTRVRQNYKDKITIQDLWAYKDRNLLYHFFLCFASSIVELERHSIHHLDFSYENFIKFYQIFEVIDLEHAYIVDKSNQKFRQINRELFDIWLQSDLPGSLDHLILSEAKYSQYKRQMWDGEITKQEAINKCMDLMYQNMKNNHYYQFYKLCRDLVTNDCLKYQGFPLSANEVEDILREIPQNPIDLKHFYVNFIQHLKDIHERYSPTRQIIGKSQYPLFKQLQQITNPEISQETMQKTIRFVHKFQAQPLRNSLQYDQIINGQQNLVLICRRDHTQFDRNHLFQKQRNLVIFLMSCILLLEQLEKNGLLLLNFGIQAFVKVGEVFLLKNFTYLFKICPKYSKVGFCTPQDAQLSRISILVLIKLSFLERSGVRDKLFDDDTFKQLFQIAFFENSQSETQNMTTVQRIKRFLQRNLKQIHFNQFRQLALSLLQNAPKHFQNTEKLKGFVKQKNLNNFYDLFEELHEINIVSSY